MVLPFKPGSLYDGTQKIVLTWITQKRRIFKSLIHSYDAIQFKYSCLLPCLISCATWESLADTIASRELKKDGRYLFSQHAATCLNQQALHCTPVAPCFAPCALAANASYFCAVYYFSDHLIIQNSALFIFINNQAVHMGKKILVEAAKK